MRARSTWRAVLPALALSSLACGSRFEGGGDLRARRVVPEREVDGLREAVARRERDQPVLPLDDVAIAIDDALVRDIIPVRIDGARMSLQVAVSQVLAGQGRLWIAMHFQPGDLAKTEDAPEAADSSADEAEVGLDAGDGAAGARAAGGGER